MSIESVRNFFAAKGVDIPIIELDTSTATVELAAAAHGVDPGRIAKTLAFRLTDRIVLILARGDARIDNRKFKEALGKGRMLPAEEVEMLTGHPVGGVCPFGLATDLPIFMDESLKDFDEILPAAGSINSAVRLAPQDLRELVEGTWIDVCKAD